MLRPRAGGRGSGVVGDPAGSARRRPRSRLPHVSLRLGPPPYTLGVPRPAPRDETEAPALPQRLLTAEQLTSPGPSNRSPHPLPFLSARTFPPLAFFFFPFLTTPPWVTLARSDDDQREEEVGAPRAGGCASGRGTSCRCRRLYGRVRIEERKGRSRVEPKLPPDLSPDPTAAGRACSVAFSFRAGGGCSFGSMEEAQAARPSSGAHHPKVRHLAPNGPSKTQAERELALQPDPLHLLQGASAPPFPWCGARPSTR
ncbi:LOW QUALITY PROTEIN: uncharacterized protein LOC116584136 [Mustela erminea]|uniref:LOW QUALITY PROTEIN: uncharacterized protein LOC116584136 n=1 Tax=Mustela erminea TaxID=36723 RepID=UPI00138707F0|nr:LOW QUALITY PROTEIN: uncharacterized protein LOC116584136 [Mustela erminea]